MFTSTISLMERPGAWNRYFFYLWLYVPVKYYDHVGTVPHIYENYLFIKIIYLLKANVGFVCLYLGFFSHVRA